MENKKPFKTIDEQIELLEKRGLIIDDLEFARKSLANHNYYRISGYSLTLRKDDRFYEGRKFSEIMQIYNFDRELKTVLLDYLANIEVAVRTHIGYISGKIDGPYGYMQAENYENQKYYRGFVTTFDKALRDNRNEVFVKHHEEARNGIFPVWVAIELLSFGASSKLFRALKVEIKKEICNEYYNGIGPKYIANWMHCLSIIRNICAHRARLFNRGLAIAPLFSRDDNNCFKEYEYLSNDIGKSLFFIIIILDRIIDDRVIREGFVEKFLNLIAKYSFVDIGHYGFKENWQEILSVVNKKYH